MQAFEYASPTTLQEALSLLGSSWNDAQVLAGGTDLISLMKDYITSPKRVVNVKAIKELGGISRQGGGLRIGATVTVDELLNSAALRDYPSLLQAARGITSPQIRNMGTVGGDLVQRPRCWYYRSGHGLLAMMNGKSLVESGQNEYHAIFGDGPAKFVSASSFGPALIALGASVKLASSSGTRTVEVAKFFLSPTSETMREVDLKPNEILTEILVPAAGGAKNATYEVRQKEALDWPLATASVSLKMKGSTVESARVVMGHVGPTPVAATAAESMLAGKAVTEDVATQAGKAAVQGAKPLSQNQYKVQLASVAVKRALMAAASGRA
jgi:xanthine dehydrogenase YagS FAD-binding subunit